MRKIILVTKKYIDTIKINKRAAIRNHIYNGKPIYLRFSQNTNNINTNLSINSINRYFRQKENSPDKIDPNNTNSNNVQTIILSLDGSFIK